MKMKLDDILATPIKIITGFREGCHLSPNLLNIYIRLIQTGKERR